MVSNTQLIKQSLKSGCPKCGSPSIFAHKFTLDVKDKCASCNLQLKNHDSGDGPAFFVICLLGFILVPLALLLDGLTNFPLWGHAVLWSVVCILVCLIVMQPLKAYMIALNFKHRDGAHGV